VVILLLEVFTRTFSKEETKEIWIYGLDGKDIFNVTGEGDDLIKIKIMTRKKSNYMITKGKIIPL